ncbi:MAG: hypothetical protein CEN87_215 [Parcubacteria group bacterium Licking1014_1]|nr:MAG: hypothetical protein CEN87_215 [Parcubacteria group bacterium Licking1014_1]
MIVEFLERKLTLIFAILLVIIFLAIDFFDKALFAGIFLIIFLTLITFFVFYKSGIKSKTFYLLFLITLVIHISVVLFFHYAKFQPFGEGDFLRYQEFAEQVAQRLSQGVYSLQGINIPHYYPVLIGVIYAFTLPSMIIGQLFSAWLSALSVILVFLIVKEISVSSYWPFVIGLIVAVLPSYLFFGSLLLKDTVVIPLVLSGLLLLLKIFKNFSWQKFAIFFTVLTALIHLRFYVGFALLLSFIICWFLISNFNIKKRILYGLFMIFLLGFSPQILNYGYYGIIPLKGYLNEKTITTYREVVYAPNPVPASVPASVLTQSPSNGASLNNQPAKKYCEECALEDAGVGSSFIIGSGFDNPIKFIFNYFVSFIYSLLGPFPWQIRHARQAFALLETIPWYFIIGIIVHGVVKSFASAGFLKTVKHYKFAAPLFIFSIVALGALSLFINNFGIIARIRIPSIIVLLCLISFDQWAGNTLKKLLDGLRYHYEKKFIKFFSLSGLRK